MENWVLGLALAIDGDLSGVLGLAPAIHGKKWVLGLALAILRKKWVLGLALAIKSVCPDKFDGPVERRAK